MSADMAGDRRRQQVAQEAGIDNVALLMWRTDVFRDAYPVVPPPPRGGPALPQHAGARYQLWKLDRRDGRLHGVRVSHPYYPPTLALDVLTAREDVRLRITQRASVFTEAMLSINGANRQPLNAVTLRAAFEANEFFGPPALADIRVLRDGRRVGRPVNHQGIVRPLPMLPPDEVRRRRIVQITVRALHRSLNRAMVEYEGQDDAQNASRWRNMRNPIQAREVWPSLSRREYWGDTAWRRALTLTGPNGAWTRGWEQQRLRIRDAAVVLQR